MTLDVITTCAIIQKECYVVIPEESANVSFFIKSHEDTSECSE